MTRTDKKNADIHTVARAAGVSISTVSRAFNHPDQVQPQTRRRIERAVLETGYIRNRAAQMIKGRRSGTVGLIVPTLEHTIFAELVTAFSDALEQAEISIILSSSNYDLEREFRLLRKMMEHRVDGVALIGHQQSAASRRLLSVQQTPAVSLWNYHPDSAFDCVGASNFDAGRTAAQHLIELGHRKIGLVFPETDANDRAADRLAGARAALAEAGLSGDDVPLITSSYSVARAKADSAPALVTRNTTALLCGNDVIGRGAALAAINMGMLIPRDQSIMAIGDFKGTAEFEPSLSTVHIPAPFIGNRAAQMLLDRMADPDLPVQRHRVNVELVPRASTAPYGH
ncbi:MAG: LacI family DNA-binding transcriptional regulator [Pseudomonadota bacterium]